jgi:hypothetical protein
MLEELHRPFTDSEKRLLRAWCKAVARSLKKDERRELVWTLAIAIAILAVRLTGRTDIALIALAVFGFERTLTLLTRWRLRRVRDSSLKRLTDELDAGTALVLACDPVRILRRKEAEDEGSLWILECHGGRYVAVCGQDGMSTVRNPMSHLEVVMGARRRTVLRVRGRGTPLPVAEIDSRVTNAELPVNDVTLFHAPPGADVPVILEALRNINAKDTAIVSK